MRLDLRLKGLIIGNIVFINPATFLLPTAPAKGPRGSQASKLKFGEFS